MLIPLAIHKSGEMKSSVSWRRSSRVSRVRCAGALSCWKIKFVPETRQIAAVSVEKHRDIVCTFYFRAWIDEKQLCTAQFRHTDRYHDRLAERVSRSKKSFGSNLFLEHITGSIHTIVLRIWQRRDSEYLFISKPHQRNLVLWVTFQKLSRSD